MTPASDNGDDEEYIDFDSEMYQDLPWRPTDAYQEDYWSCEPSAEYWDELNNYEPTFPNEEDTNEA